MTIFLLFSIEVLATLSAWHYVVKFNSGTPLQMLIMLNMVMITLFGGIFDTWLATNCGNVFYAEVILAQFLIMQHFGWRDGLRCLFKVFAGLVVLQLCLWSLLLAIDEPHEKLVYLPVIEESTKFTVASFFAFWLGQCVFVAMFRTWQRRTLRWRYGAAMVAAQAIDSVIFFPVAFGFTKETIDLVLAGFAMKVFFGMLALPVIPVLLRSAKDREW